MIPFGKKIKAGNFYIVKTSRSLSKKDIQVLRKQSGIPLAMQKDLSRSKLTYIKVSTITENWAVEYAPGLSMFSALDNLTPEMKDGGLTLTGAELANVSAMFALAYADTSIAGDADYVQAKTIALNDLMGRMMGKENEADTDKNDEQLQKESDDAAQEVLDKVEYAESLKLVGENLKKEEEL